jgi:hypothetical protein
MKKTHREVIGSGGGGAASTGQVGHACVNAGAYMYHYGTRGVAVMMTFVVAAVVVTLA